jgi:hypothetical protein
MSKMVGEVSFVKQEFDLDTALIDRDQRLDLAEDKPPSR